MKQPILLFFALCSITFLQAQSVGIGTETPHASAVMDVSSTTQGMLIPRMTTAQREMIASPAAGLLVYDITTSTFWFRNESTWTELVGGGDTEVHRNGPDMIYMGLTDSVGVGTMTPERKFQVRTGNNQYGISHVNDSVELATYVDNTYGGWIGTTSNHPMNLYAGDGFNQFKLLPNGNVGINTPSPTQKLHLTGNSFFDGNMGIGTTPLNILDISQGITRTGTHPVLRPLYVTGNLGAADNGIEFRHANGTQGIGFGFSWIYATGSNTSQDIGLTSRGTGGRLFFASGNEIRMAIDSTGQVGIGTSQPEKSSLLEINSTNKGMLMPRMTTAQRDAIVSPAEGLQILNLDDHCLDIYDGDHWIKSCGMKVVGMDTLGGWKKKASIPIPGIARTVSFSIGAIGYYGTGFVEVFEAEKSLWAYDPVTDAWTQKSDFGGVGRKDAVGFSIDGKGYIGSGLDAGGSFLSDFWRYDPMLNTWVSIPNLPAGRSNAAGFSIGSDGYIVGGFTNAGWSNGVYRYNPTGNTWVQMANFPLVVQSAVAFAIGGKGYVGTGTISAISVTDKFYEYDPLNNSWTQKANFGGGQRSGATGIAIGSKGYVGLGVIGGIEKKDLWEYDPMANTWTTAQDFPGSGVQNAFGFSIGEVGYFGGGRVDYDVKREFYQYTPYSLGPVYSMPAPPPGTYSTTDGIWTRKAEDAFKTGAGEIGIGVSDPENKLDIHTGPARMGNHPSGLSLYTTGDFLSDNGVEFRHYNGSQGIGIGSTLLYAAGSNESQHIGLKAKGTTGEVNFYAGGGERMRIESDGDVLVGMSDSAALKFVAHLVPRKIVFYDLAGNNHQFSGLGLEGNYSMRYQTPFSSSEHIFYRATSPTSSMELLRIKSNGNLSVAGTIESEAYIQPTLLNGFANYGGGFANAGYYKDKTGIVRLRGLVNTAANPSGLVIFTLPAGYRPSTSGTLLFMTGNNNSLGRIDILPNGDLYVMVGAAGWFNLDGISFRAD